MRVGITGSTSVIGQRLIVKLSESSHTPIPFGGSKSKIWVVGEECPSNLNLDALVHLAHDRSLSVEENIHATTVLCNSFKGRKVFLSSFSAHSKSLSRYGKSKYAMESIFNNSNGSSIRSGVVYIDELEGIFAQIQLLIGKMPIITLPYRGSSLLFTTHVDDLISEILFLLNQREGVTTFAAHPIPTTLRNLSFQIQKVLGTKKLTIGIWRQPLDFFLRIFVQVFPNFPMADSLLSLSCEASYEELSKLRIAHSNFREFYITD